MLPTNWWAPGWKVPTGCDVESVAASVAGVVSETLQMSYAWRNHDPSSGSWQRTLASLSWEQCCLWAWTGEEFPDQCMSKHSSLHCVPDCPLKYHPSARHHRAQTFSRPLRALPLSMHRKGKKRQEQERHGLGDTVALQHHLIFFSLCPTSLYVRLMHTYKHKITPCLRGSSGCRPGEGTAESF